MKLARKFKKRELILIWFCLIIIVAILTDTAISRLNLKFGRLEEEIALNQKRLVKLNTILRQAKELNSEYERLLSGYKELKDPGALLEDIANIAKRLNINILNIKPDGTLDEGLYKTYSVKIEAQEEMSSLVKFLRILNEELRGINIGQLQISTQAKEELPKVNILINAVVFKR